MKFSIKDFFSKCDQIQSFLRIWSYLLKKFWIDNFIFCAVLQLHLNLVAVINFDKYLATIITISKENSTSTKKSYILKQTSSGKVKVCLSMYQLIVDTRY